MLRQLSARHVPFRLNRPFRISRGVKTAADTVQVEIAAGEHVGRGESVPYARYGESIDSVLRQVEAVRDEIERGAGRDRLVEIMPPGAARNALDCALWDLEARVAGRSITETLGWGALKPVPTAMTISLDTPAAMARAAAAISRVPLLKVKVDAENPVDAVRAVREAAPGPRMIVDPNESWTIAQLADWQDALAELRVDLLEQPLPADRDEALEGFARRVPLAADESGHVTGDLAHLARRYDVVNIKLDKTGGLTTALAMMEAVRQVDIRLMIGCMVSSSLSIMPAMIVAQHCGFVDLDGPTWLAEDMPGGVSEAGGVMAPAERGFWGEI